jgi:hypothetical protein
MNPQLNAISRRVMLALSLFAMTLVVGATILTVLGRFTPSPDGDEGTAAHLFQLAVVLTVPAGFAFLLTADWRVPARVMKGLIAPATALGVAFATLYYMEHLR